MSIENLYSELNIDISLDEFEEMVEDKIKSMGGLCDEESAAKLVAHEIEGEKLWTIDDISVEMGEVRFLGKIMNMEEPSSFERDDGTTGRVANIELADETGRVRVAFWDNYADNVEDLEEGQVLKVVGKPKETRYGIEVNANRAEIDEDAKIEIEAAKISEVESGSEVSLQACVLDISEPRYFERDEGEGRVGNVFLGDKTGWIQVAVWDEKVDLLDDIEVGDCIHVDGYARMRNGNKEINVGRKGSIEKIEDSIDIGIDTDSIEDIEPDGLYDIKGVVVDSESTYKFQRNDGSQGRVKNIELRDSTGNLDIALWGRHTEKDIDIGDKILVLGLNVDESDYGLEGNLNWDGVVFRLE